MPNRSLLRTRSLKKDPFGDGDYWPNPALNLITPIDDNLQVIAAEGEQKASRALKEASDIISESPAALQLRS